MYNQFYPYMMTGTLPNATRMASPLMSAVRTSPLSSLFGVRGAPAVSALGSATKASTFTFTGLLNGASKTLGVINQSIPVFYQIKPIINNAKTMYRVAKEINSNDRKNNNTSINNRNNTFSYFCSIYCLFGNEVWTYSSSRNTRSNNRFNVYWSICKR